MNNKLISLTCAITGENFLLDSDKIDVIAFRNKTDGVRVVLKPSIITDTYFYDVTQNLEEVKKLWRGEKQ